MLDLVDVSITLAGRRLFRPVDLSVRPGTVGIVMGPSGIGKSSLLDAVLGTLDPKFRLNGTIRLSGRDLSGLTVQARSIGILFQDDLLFPHLSVSGNLAFALKPGGSRAERAARIDDALEQAGLKGFGPRDPATLSGGQKARVAVLRALLAEPSALLLDEPFGRLDAALRPAFADFVRGRIADLAIPALMVTHDRADIRNGDTIVELVSEEGEDA